MREGAQAATALAEPPIGGRYRPLRELGRGASGRVVLAEDLAEGGALRAIKLVGRAEVERLAWEFEQLRAVAHPNVARVRELLRLGAGGAGQGADPGQAAVGALVAEYAPGRSARLLAVDTPDRQARLALALRVGLGVSRALSAIHARGMVHGDVKPDNVVVDTDLTVPVVLVDLGLSAPPGVGRRVSGTLGFIAPEVLHGERGVAADLFALGVTLARILEGSPVSAHTGQLPTPDAAALLAPLEGWVPAPLRRLITELTAIEPRLRPARALDVAARLLDLMPPDAAASGVAQLGSDEPTAQELSARMAHLPAVGLASGLAALHAAGRGRVVVVHGPDGAGRSRLIREYVGQLQHAGLLAGQRVPTYRAVSAPPRAALGQDTVLHVLPQAQVDLAQLELLLSAAAVEGAQLTVLWERADALQDAAQGFEDIEGIEGIVQVAVGPLAEPQMRALLVEAIGGTPSTSLVREAMTASGGLAGRICRLLSLGARAGIAKWSGARLREFATRDGATAVAVPDAATALAELLALSGGCLPAAVAQAAVPDSTQQAELLRVVGLLVLDDAGLLTLRRDVVAAVLSAIPGRRRVALARGVPVDGLPPEASAHLALVSGELDEAVACMLAAMRAARVAGTPATAAAMAAHFAGALAAPAPAALRLAWGDALRAEGRYREALPLLGALRCHPDVDADADVSKVALLRAELLRLCGERAGAQALATEVFEAGGEGAAAAAGILARLALDAGDLDATSARLQQAGDARGNARLEETRALLQLYRGDPVAALATTDGALAAVRAAADVAAEGRLCGVAAWCLQELGRAPEASRRLADAVACAERGGEQHAIATSKMNLALDGLERGELGRCLTELSDAARRLARLGRDGDVARALYNLAYVRHLCGDGDGADAAARLAEAAAGRCGDPVAAGLSRGLRAEVAAVAGDLAPARAFLAELDVEGMRAPDAANARVRAIELSLTVDDVAAAAVHLEKLRALVDGGAGEAGGAGASAPHECAIAAARVSLAQGDVTGALDAALAAHAATAQEGFDLRLRSALCAAACAAAAGQAELVRALRAEVRASLDAAARGLTLADRARLRKVPAYRRAWEVAPRSDAAGAPMTAGQASEAGHARLLSLAKRFMPERRPKRLYEHILDAALELSNAERGCLLLRRPDGVPSLRASRGLTGEELSGGGPALSRSVVTRVLSSGQPMSTVDALSDARLAGAESVHALSMRSVAAVPLWLDNEVAGAIYVEDRLRPFAFREHEMALLADLAHLSSIALDSVRALRSERRNARRLSAVRAKLARQVQTQAVELTSLRRQASSGRGGMVGSSASVARLVDMIERVAPADVPVLVLGESGTGKELAARALHAASPRGEAPFVGENCSAIPESLLESALFGHVKGAFTGADRERTGLFEAADGGTLFLDEVGEMSAGMQTRLLRVLENGRVRPVGGERERTVDVRVVAATHRDLQQMVAEGSFREDLYYRLAVVGIEMPPLRDRTEDIDELVAHFCAKHAPGRRIAIAPDVLPALRALPWPGNVRQLENEIRRALVLAEDRIEVGHFSPRLIDGGGQGREGGGRGDLRAQVDQLERRLIREALAATDGNQTQAAKALGVSRFGLQKMIKRLSPLM